jgi:Na+-translocating ferredoxin:NAD+ oxidoreductase subunit G
MAKRESSFFNMVITLLLVSFVSAASLGFIHEITKEPIAIAKAEKKNRAIRAVVPEFNNNPTDEAFTVTTEEGDLLFYPARLDGELVGTAVETFTNNGFSGTIKLMVGLLPDGSIQRIEVLEHKETPGLGDKMETGKSDFHLQFTSQNPETFRIKVKKDGGDVDAITASTITTRAYCEAVQRAWETYTKGGQQ